MELEWNIVPRFTTLQLCKKVHEFMSKMGDPSEFKRRIIFMSMFNDILLGFEDNERECNANADQCLYLKKDSHQDDGHSLELDQKRSGILLTLPDYEENGTESLNR